MQPLMMSNPHDVYRKQGVMTASPLELIIMLFDALKKNLLLAQRAIGKKDVATAHKKFMRAQDIVSELINCLDLSISMSKDLMQIYEFMLYTIEDSNLKKEASLIDPLIEIVESLRDAWNEVNEMQKGKAGPSFEGAIAASE